ncbi:hypothetical protein [Flavobacterium sp.]|uniref:hypothetical protein n=1 Tax=Flavobacterium sp. TaxID=239 RepID=UPI002BBC4447|nr:hypothetical protein [Flavobacterium sp.]HSD08308.1 hypothetical protein [Flavobacterium sp.]
MEHLFLISFNIKTPSGFESYVTFNLGEKGDKAKAIFDMLNGSLELSDKTILTMDFTEMKDGIPLPIKMLDCTLDQVIDNTKIITRELFKNLNLDEE